MNAADITLVSTFYLDTFTAPLFRASKLTELKKYIGIAAAILEVNEAIDFGISSYSLTKELVGVTKVIDVDVEPLVGISAMTLEGDDILNDDYSYEQFRSHISFITSLGEGSFAMTYTAGIASVLNDTEKLALSLMVNHLIETKMINSERIGIITTRPDRSIVPQEVKTLLGISNMGMNVL